MQDTFPLEITHERGDECQRETTQLNRAEQFTKKSRNL